MMRKLICLLLTSIISLQTMAQERTVENRPYTDLRPFHFGVIVGTHLQDIEFENVGPQIITYDDGTTAEKLITCDQDRWDAGFTVGVLGEARINNHFAFRLAPTMYFGTKHITFHNFTDKLEDGSPIIQNQEMKTVYIALPCNLIFGAKRFNNHRPYLMAGLNPMLNLSRKNDAYLKLKNFDCMVEIGVGCDFYLPFFKLRPELKFSYSLTNCLDTKHPDQLKDKNALAYAKSVNVARSKIIALTFYFE